MEELPENRSRRVLASYYRREMRVHVNMLWYTQMTVSLQHMLWFFTSESSCFPKNMSDEMALTSSPNFFRASPESDTGTGSGFLLDVRLVTDNKIRYNSHELRRDHCAASNKNVLTCHREKIWRRTERSPALVSCSLSSSLLPRCCHPTERRNDPRPLCDPQTGTS